MVFREVSVIEVREVLRAWLVGHGLADGGRAGGCGPQDGAPLCRGGGGGRAVREGGEQQLTDELVGRW